MDLHFSITGDESLTPQIDNAVGSMQQVVDEAVAASQAIDRMIASARGLGELTTAADALDRAFRTPAIAVDGLNAQLSALKSRVDEIRAAEAGIAGGGASGGMVAGLASLPPWLEEAAAAFRAAQEAVGSTLPPWLEAAASEFRAAEAAASELDVRIAQVATTTSGASSRIAQLRAAAAAAPDARVVRGVDQVTEPPPQYAGAEPLVSRAPGPTTAALAEEAAALEEIRRKLAEVKNASSATGRAEFLSGIQEEAVRADAGLGTLFAEIDRLRGVMDQMPSSRGLSSIDTALTRLDEQFQKLEVTAGASLTRIESMPTQTVAQLDRANAALIAFGNTSDANMQKAQLAIGLLEEKLGTLPAATDRATGGMTRLDQEVRQKPSDFEKATSAASGFLSTLTGFVGGQIAFALLGDLTRGVNAVTTALTQGAIADQSYVATYSNLLGSVGAAVAHVNELRQEATDLPVPTDKLIDADRRMQAALAPGQTFLQHYGETQKDVTRTLADVATARPDINIALVASAIERVSVGAPRASQSIKQLGLSAEELAAAGAQLNRQGTAFLPNRDLENTRAVIIALEQKYKDMAATHSQTFQGMGQEMQNWVSLASSLLGRDMFAEIRTRLREFLDNLKDPAFQATLADWGDKLGRVTHFAFEAFDTLVNGAKLAWGAIKPVVDLIGQLLGNLQQSSSAASPFAGITGGAQDFTDQMNLGNQAVDQTAQQAEALNARIKALENSAEAVRNKYASLIDPLKEQETALDRIFQRGQEQNELDKLNKEIARDKALAVDAYSSEGQAAALRLVGEEEQKANLEGTIRHNTQKQNLEDRIKGYENEQKSVEASLKAQEAALRAQVDALKAQDSWYNHYPEKGGKVTATNSDVTTSTNTVRFSFDNLLAKIKQVLGPEGFEALRTGWAGIVEEFGKFPSQIAPVLKSLGDLIHSFGADAGVAMVAVVAKYAVITAIEDMATVAGGMGLTIQSFLLNMTHNLDDARVGWMTLRDIMSLKDPSTDAALQLAITQAGVSKLQAGAADTAAAAQRDTVLKQLWDNGNRNAAAMNAELSRLRNQYDSSATYNATNPGGYANYGYGGTPPPSGGGVAYPGSNGPGVPGAYSGGGIGTPGAPGDVIIRPATGGGSSSYHGGAAVTGLSGGQLNVNVTTSNKCPSCGRVDFQNNVKTDIGFIANQLANNYRANNR